MVGLPIGCGGGEQAIFSSSIIGMLLCMLNSLSEHGNLTNSLPIPVPIALNLQLC